MKRSCWLKKPAAILLALLLAISSVTPVMAKTTRKPYIQKEVNLTLEKSEHVPFLWVNNEEVTYTISDPSVAVIDPNSAGVCVRAVNPGTAILKAHYRGKTYSSKVTVKKIPFEQETFWVRTNVESHLKEGEEFSFEALKNAKQVAVLEWEAVPGADGYEIRRVAADGSMEYESFALRDLPDVKNFYLRRTTKGAAYYRYDGKLASHSDLDSGNADIIYEVDIRAYQIVKGEKHYTDWHWTGIYYGIV